jgi:tripartite-type tricarboxylate transporter receptor subunit TctC
MVFMRFIATLLLALPFAPAPAFAQAPYPSKPIRMIVPFAPGGASDFVARIIAPRMSEILGQQLVIDNRAGVSGNIGMDAAAKSPPDGYTLFLGNIGTIAINPAIFSNLSVNPVKDFVAVSLVAEVPSILITLPAFGADTVGELVTMARARPGAFNFASPGSSTLNRLEMERFMKMANISMVHIPYKGGAGPAVAGLLSNDTHCMFVTLSSAMALIQAGRLKALGVTTAKRLEGLAQVPTFIEAGYPEMVSSSWQGLFVPAGTPRAIVEKLDAALHATLAAPEMRQRFAVGGAQIVTSATPEEFASFVAAEAVRWGKVARETGATVD